MIAFKFFFRCTVLGLLACAIIGRPTLSRAQDSADITNLVMTGSTNAVPAAKHHKKKKISNVGTNSIAGSSLSVSTNGFSGTNGVSTTKHRKKKSSLSTNAPTASATAMATTPTTPASKAPTQPTSSTIEPTTTPKTPGTAHNKSGVLPFHGKLKAVDLTAKTISVGTRVFEITSDTVITKNNQPATLADGIVGDEVGGGYKKNADGTLVITKMRFGPKVAPEK